MMGLFIVTEFKKLITSITLAILAIGGLVSAYVNYAQSQEIQELRYRINILEKFTSTLIDLV